MIEGMAVLLMLFAASFAAGYLTRGYISHKRRAEARKWRAYGASEWSVAANTNVPSAAVQGDLGQMLDRWENGARERRFSAERKRG